MQAYVSRKHETDMVVVYERAGVVFAFNFHPSQSYTNYKVGVQIAGMYPLHHQPFYLHITWRINVYIYYYCITFLYNSIMS